jgi:hypothetical protein
MLKYDEHNGYTLWGFGSANMLVAATFVVLGIGLMSVFALPGTGGVSAEGAKGPSVHAMSKLSAPDVWTAD